MDCTITTKDYLNRLPEDIQTIIWSTYFSKYVLSRVKVTHYDICSSCGEPEWYNKNGCLADICPCWHEFKTIDSRHYYKCMCYGEIRVVHVRYQCYDCNKD